MNCYLLVGYSSNTTIVLFYCFNDDWKKLLPKIDESEPYTEKNLDFDIYITTRIKNKSNKYIPTLLSPIEEKYYLFEI